MGHNARDSVGGKTPVQAALDDVKQIKQKTNRKDFMVALLGISEDQYRHFMHGLSVWNEKASPTIEELSRLKDEMVL